MTQVSTGAGVQVVTSGLEAAAWPPVQGRHDRGHCCELCQTSSTSWPAEGVMQPCEQCQHVVPWPASRQSVTRAKQWFSVLFLQEYDKKRETKNRERQLYHLRHSNDYDMLELPMGASKVSTPAAAHSSSLGQSNPDVASPPSQHCSMLMILGGLAPGSLLLAPWHITGRAPDRAWALSASCVL